MKILIKTTKPEIIEPEMKKAVEGIKEKWQPDRKLRFFMKIAKVDLNMFKESIFADYKKIDENSFEFLINYPNIEHTKSFLINNLLKELKKIDEKVEINEI